MAAGNGFLLTSPDARYGDAEGAAVPSETLAQKFVCPGSGSIEISEIGLYTYNAGEGLELHLAIFEHDAVNDCPSTIVANSDTGEIGPALPVMAKLNHLYGTKPTLTGGGTYWLGSIQDDNNKWSGFATGGAVLYTSAVTYPAWPTDSEWHTHSDQEWDTSLYAVYGTAATLVIQDMAHAHTIPNVVLAPISPPFDPVNANYLKEGSLSVSLGGAGMSPDPIAGEWSAVIASPGGIFHPLHPTSLYADWFRVGRPVRISLGANYDGEDRWWTRLTGYMDAPHYDHGSQTISIRGMDFMKRLTDTKLRSPDNYWGDVETYSTVASVMILGTEMYHEIDAMEIGASEANNVTNWVVSDGTFESFTDGGGGSTYVGLLEPIDDADSPVVYNDNVGSFTAGTSYAISFKYKRTSPWTPGSALSCYIYKSASITCWGSISNLKSATWETAAFTFVCPETATGRMTFKLSSQYKTGAVDVQVDEISIKPITGNAFNAPYELPAGSNGPYLAVLDDVEIWFGEGRDEWTFDEATGLFQFSEKKIIAAGTDNLDIYYFTTQTVENVVADILANGPAGTGGGVGLYANQAAALAAMDYTATGVTIPRVWFGKRDALPSALEAIRMLCERVNYRFWFDHNGVPHFKPAPTAGTPVFDFDEIGHIQSPTDYQDFEEVRNRIIIEGIEQGMYAAREDKKTSRFTGEAHDQDSIDAYTEHTLPITNHLFQDQESIDAMCATLLAERKDPKWYSSIPLPFNPVPLQLGDTITWKVAFESNPAIPYSAALAAWPRGILFALPIPTADLVDFPVEVPIVAGSPESIAIGAACRANGYDIRFTAADGVTLLDYERESFAVADGEATGIFWVKTDVATAGTHIWCYSDDTDILTEDGWKNIKDVVENKDIAKLATLNPETNSVEYHHPEKFFKIRHQGKMLHQGGKGIDFLVTPNHRVYARPCWDKTGDGKPNDNEFGLIKADELPRHVEYRRDFPYEGKETPTFTLPGYSKTTESNRWPNSPKLTTTRQEKQYAMDDFLRVFGIWIAEGSLSKNGTIDISQKQAEKTKVIKGWVKKLGYSPGETGSRVYFCDMQLNRWLKQFGHSKDKFIPASFKSLSKRQLRILLDAMILGDGSKRGEPKNDCYYATISPRLADDVQEIALKCGYTATLSKRLPKNNACSFKSDSILYVITLGEKCKLPKPNDHNDQREWVDYDGYTYCVEVPNHIVFVRRNGKPLWNGNCYYGNAAAADGQNAEAVWDANFKAVYHMNDATTSTIADSTINANNGTKKGANEPIEAAGKIAKGQDFDGSDDFVNCGNNSSLDITDQMTIESWVKLGSSQEQRSFFARFEEAAHRYVLGITDNNFGMPNSFKFYTYGAGGEDALNSPRPPDYFDGEWHHVVGTYDGTNKRLYVDGSEVNSVGHTGSLGSTGAPLLHIGNIDFAGGIQAFDGLVDECRLSAFVRTPAWIAYEYANMNPADGGLTWGEEETRTLIQCTGIIRDIKIDGPKASYKCQLV